MQLAEQPFGIITQLIHNILGEAEVINAPAIEGLAALENDSVSGVVMRSFLEHEHQPRSLLTEIARVLAPGGAAIVKVPNYGSLNRIVMGPRWCGFRFPGHVNYFTPGTLRSMVEQADLAVVRFGPTDRFPLSDNMWMVAARDPADASTAPPPRHSPNSVRPIPSRHGR